jgi:integrase
VLCYRNRSGAQRRLTIGSFPDWKTVAARGQARRLKREIDGGKDPLGEAEALKRSPTVTDLCERFLDEVASRKAARTLRDYKQQCRSDIQPVIGKLKVEAVTFGDADQLFRSISKRAPVHANRVASLGHRLFAMATKWHWRTSSNPFHGLERNKEHARQRYLEPEQLAQLLAAINAYPHKQAANALRLLLLTGARSSEVLSMKWEDIDLGAHQWNKPGTETKQRKFHSTPLSSAACLVLAEIDRTTGSPFVFPSNTRDGHRKILRQAWIAICTNAGIHDFRIHDLRHQHASALASAGFSLPVIGRLLGHSVPATTQRYAHLMKDPLRQAAERAGELLTSEWKQTDVIALKR